MTEAQVEMARNEKWFRNRRKQKLPDGPIAAGVR